MTALTNKNNEPEKKAKKNALLIFWVGLMIVFVIAFLFYFYIPPATDIGAAQPIAFSHRVHAGVKDIQCQFCHSYVDRSIHPGIPPVEKCLYCHNYVIANHPEIQKEHMYFNTQTPTPWKKVFLFAGTRVFQSPASYQKRYCLSGMPWPYRNNGSVERRKF